ncbi:MAG: sigma-70 family RNA polymerase sigma factor [Deltaproteobacteria bacterium]|nr:sigma-70 family RNA polymerase sigma factor [Deltaproteobacteria bacterium]
MVSAVISQSKRGQARPVEPGRSDAPAAATAAAEDEDEAERLVASLRRADSAAFTALYQRYHRSMLRVAAAYVSSHAVVEEVVQETWLAVLEGIARFEQRSSFRTWLFAILVNRAKTRGQREKRSVPFSVLAGDPDDAAQPGSETVVAQALPWPGAGESPEASPETELGRKRMVEVLEQALSRLPENYQVVVTMRDIEGIDAAEVCRLLDISAENQRVLLHRARHRLRDLLSEIVPALEGR